MYISNIMSIDWEHQINKLIAFCEQKGDPDYVCFLDNSIEITHERVIVVLSGNTKVLYASDDFHTARFSRTGNIVKTTFSNCHAKFLIDLTDGSITVQEDHRNTDEHLDTILNTIKQNIETIDRLTSTNKTRK